MRESRLSGSVEGVMSDHHSYSDSHSVRPAGAFARAFAIFGLRHTPGWGNFERTGGLPQLPRLLRFCLAPARNFRFQFIATRNHRAVAKRSDAVLPGMARSYSTPVRRVSGSFTSDAKLARLELEFYRGGTRKLQRLSKRIGFTVRFLVGRVIPQRVEKTIDANRTGGLGFSPR